MIKHIVMWKFKDEAEGHTKEENMEIIRTRLMGLVGVIPEIKSLEIGKDILKSDMSFDMALIGVYESLEALDIYKNHPEHRKISAYVKACRLDRVAVDFEF